MLVASATSNVARTVIIYDDRHSKLLGSREHFTWSYTQLHNTAQYKSTEAGERKTITGRYIKPHTGKYTC